MMAARPPSDGVPEVHGALREAVARRASFARTVRAVAWSFFGVRKSSENEKDLSQLNPVHVIVAGLLAAAVFVTALLAFVRWIIGTVAPL
jgi:hypothetical protein